MTLQSLVGGGADCGPVNPLARLGKVVERPGGDGRELARESWNNGGSGARLGWRSGGGGTSNGVMEEVEEQYGQFGGHGQGDGFRSTDDAFMMQDLERSLQPSGQQPFSHTTTLSTTKSAWAQDFAKSGWAKGARRKGKQAAQGMGTLRPPTHQDHRVYHQPAPRAPLYADYGPPLPFLDQSQGQGLGHRTEEDWERHFATALTSEAALAKAQVDHERPYEVDKEIVIDDPDARSALAKTAGLLVESVEKQTEEREKNDEDSRVNEKFANSSFMNLMRRLRDQEVAIEGDKVVEQGPSQRAAESGGLDGMAGEFKLGMNHASPSSRSMTDSLRPMTNNHAIHTGLDRPYNEQEHELNERLGRNEINEIFSRDDREREEEERSQFERLRARAAFQGDGGALAIQDLEESWARSRGQDGARTKSPSPANNIYKDSHVPGAQAVNWEEDFDTVAEPDADLGRIHPSTLNAQQEEWNRMQNDWEEFDQAMQDGQQDTAQALPTMSYRFQSNNPFLQREAQRISNHYESILEKEAEVQKDPQNAKAWYELGLRQQENERESSAIAALQKAVEIDPTLRDAWLALAVSHTNENSREEALDALTSWLETNENYKGYLVTSSGSDRHEMLTRAYVQAAANASEESMDADVQVGLGVLFNLTEDYPKAIDCFQTALSIRPRDDLLWNKLGATLANSHNVDAAIQAYHTALEINPSYTRCLYNLAVACLQRNEYTESAHHLLNALVIQSRDASGVHAIQGDHATDTTAGPFGGVTSSNLWDCLRMTLYLLNRPDLAERCDFKDLDSFRRDFEFDEV